MRKMTRLQELLSTTAISKEGKTDRLFEDFPEILNDAKFANSIYERVHKGAGLDSIETSARCHIVVEDGLIIFTSRPLLTVLDVYDWLSMYLPLLYSLYVPQGKYDKKKVLDQALATVCEVLDYLEKLLERVPSHPLMKSWHLVLASKGEFGSLPVQETRALIDKWDRIKFKPGRKASPAGEVGRIYQDVSEILRPGFNQADKLHSKIGACRSAVEKYKKKLGLRWVVHVENLADRVYEHKKPERAAIFLTAQILKVDKKTVERRLKRK